MARFYHWMDTGSPSRSLSGSMSNRLKQILLACLVYGYGSKPAAGWSLVHEASGGFSLRNATGTGIINFSDWGATVYGTVKITLLETITGGITNAIPTGDNLRSGYGAPGATPHGLFMYGQYQNPSTLVWTVVADERSFSLYIAAAARDLTSSGSYSYSRNTLLVAGESSAGLFYAHGGLLGTSETMSFTATSFPGHTALRDQTTGLIISGAGGTITQGLANSGGATSSGPDLIGDLPLSKVPLFYSGTIASYHRGLVASHHHFAYNDSAAMGLLGLVASDDNRGKPVALGDLALASVSAELAYGRRVFLTDHPDYW
ncbi:hypothetical protein [Azotobacter beijerinckii]|uniref:Uncharacterized protein n=1 Tax=Azotobacter beijerinckii TaxID=170623 RepID=A0A1I4G3C2_9GAMM|nr:hypothetical protein [Azotobacter beijerinckii]SFL23737.1 hypothetical protein SAMN04244574_03637 [Azotobacter beijerinckii]